MAARFPTYGRRAMLACMNARRLLPFLLLIALPAAAQPAPEEIGPWRLACATDRMTDRAACVLRHRDWVERPSAQPGLSLEIMERGGRLVPAITARDLSVEGAARGLLALTGTAQLRLDAQPVMELPCSLEGRSLICVPRNADLPRAAQDLPNAERALVRMAGLGTSTTEPTELRLTNTAAALTRLQQRQPAGSTTPEPGGLDLRDILLRLQRLLP